MINHVRQPENVLSAFSGCLFFIAFDVFICAVWFNRIAQAILYI
ncbi:hypothetical protein [Kingella oralis]